MRQSANKAVVTSAETPEEELLGRLDQEVAAAEREELRVKHAAHLAIYTEDPAQTQRYRLSPETAARTRAEWNERIEAARKAARAKRAERKPVADLVAARRRAADPRGPWQRSQDELAERRDAEFREQLLRAGVLVPAEAN